MRRCAAEARLAHLSKHIALPNSSSTTVASTCHTAAIHGPTLGIMPGTEEAVALQSRTATRCGPGGTLAPAQIESYVRDGFLLVSGLIPPRTLDCGLQVVAALIV